MSSDGEDAENADEAQAAPGVETDPLNMPAGDRWTHSTFILVEEARLMAEGAQLDNPAFPIDQRTADRARQQIKQRGIDQQPIWKDVTQFPDLATRSVLDE